MQNTGDAMVEVLLKRQATDVYDKLNYSLANCSHDFSSRFGYDPETARSI